MYIKILISQYSQHVCIDTITCVISGHLVMKLSKHVVSIDHIAVLVDIGTSIMLKGVLQSHKIKSKSG